MAGREARDVVESESCQVSLRIKHPSIDPDQITEALALTPEHAWACGEPRMSDAGTALGGTRRNSYWSARLPAASWSDLGAAMLSVKEWRRSTPRELPPALAEVAQDVTGEASALGHMPAGTPLRTPAWQLFVQLWCLKKHRELFENIEREGGEVSLAVEIEPGSSLTIEPLLGRLISELGLRVEFEIA